MTRPTPADIDAVAREHAVRQMLRPADHVWTRAEIDAMSTEEFDVNAAAIAAAVRAGAVH